MKSWRIPAWQRSLQELSCSLAQLSLAWCLTNPHVSSVITGATRVEQVKENMKALEVVTKLAPDVLSRVDAIVGTNVE